MYRVYQKTAHLKKKNNNNNANLLSDDKEGKIVKNAYLIF